MCGSKLFRRKDDASEIVKKRLQEYHKLTEPILKKFGKIVQHIDVSTDFMSGIMSIVNEIKREQKIRRVRIRSLAQCRQNEG